MFILDLSINRNFGTGGQNSLQPPQSGNGEEAFNQFTKADQQVEEKKTGLSRTNRRNLVKSEKRNEQFLDLISDPSQKKKDEFREVMVDGQVYTLRLLAVA